MRKLTPEMADRLDMPAGKGVIVQDVKPGSFAEDINLGRGDVILEVNKQPVNSEEEFAKVESEPEERSGCGIPGASARLDRGRMGPSSWPGHFRNLELAQRELALPPSMEDDYNASSVGPFCFWAIGY